MGQGFESLQARQIGCLMVGVVQWLERQIVALEIVGSSPTSHPFFLLRGQPRWGVAKRQGKGL